jgi:hypothetical protein
MKGITRLVDKASRSILDEAFWQWSAEMPRPRRGPLPARPRQDAEALYFPACISRIMGALPDEQQETSCLSQRFRYRPLSAGICSCMEPS